MPLMAVSEVMSSTKGGAMYKIRRFPVFGAEKTKQKRSSYLRVLPDGRSVVDAKDLLQDPAVKSLLESLEKRIKAADELEKLTEE